MSERHELSDQRTQIIGPLGTATVGFYHKRDSNGGNYTENEPSGTPHGYSLSLLNHFATAFSWRYKANHDLVGYYQATFPSIEGPGWTDNDQLKLVKKLASKMDQTQFDAGVFGVELGRSVDMLADRGRQLHDAYQAARHGRLKDVRDIFLQKPRKPETFKWVQGGRYGKLTANDRKKLDLLQKQNNRMKLSDAQLEFQFGVRPLMNDIFDLSQTIQRWTKSRGTRVTATRKVVSKVVPHQFFPGVGTAFESKSIVAYLEQEETTVMEHLGLANPLGQLYELTPWSFALDWVLPIGDFIEAQSFKLRAKGVFVETFFSHYEASGSVNTFPYDQYSEPIENVAPWFVNYTTVERTVSTTINVPLPHLKSSLLGGEPLTRLANAWALLAGARRAGLTNKPGVI